MSDRGPRRVFICQTNYIPWKGYFDAIHHCDEFVLYDDMQYTKERLAKPEQGQDSQGQSVDDDSPFEGTDAGSASARSEP